MVAASLKAGKKAAMLCAVRQRSGSSLARHARARSSHAIFGYVIIPIVFPVLLIEADHPLEALPGMDARLPADRLTDLPVVAPVIPDIDPALLFGERDQPVIA